jgi:hypothetical protein
MIEAEEKFSQFLRDWWLPQATGLVERTTLTLDYIE